MTGPEGAIPDSQTAVSHEPEPERRRHRTSFFARAAHGVKERWVANRIAVIAVASTLMVITASMVGWRFFEEWRAGHIELKTVGAPLVVQVLAEASDAPIGAPFDLISRAQITLPAGEYRLRVDGNGRLGRTYRFAVNRGETQAHTLSIDEGRLLGGEPPPPNTLALEEKKRYAPIPFAPLTSALELTPGKADLIEWSEGSLICRDAASGKVLWDALKPKPSFNSKFDPARWVPDLSPKAGQGELLEPAVDLDGDGTRDLLWSLRSAAAFLALSGKNGAMLWNYVAELDGPGGPRDFPGVNRLSVPLERHSGVAEKVMMADVDRDGTPDVVAMIVFPESPAESTRRLREAGDASPVNEEVLFKRVAVALSGQSGSRLWSHPIDQDWSTFPAEPERRISILPRGRAKPLIAFLDGTQWSGLDPATGQVQARPTELGLVPVRPLQYGDLDGDGEPEILALGPGSNPTLNTLHAFSIKTSLELWVADVGAPSETDGPFLAARSGVWDAPSFPECPLVADLDGDGRSEIVVPDTGAMPSLSGFRGVRLIDGASGATRWQRAMRPQTTAKDGVAHIVAAPDLDGDGTRDVIVVSRFDGQYPFSGAQERQEDPERVFVDALSGQDGRPLWWWHVDLPMGRIARIGAPVWWGRGPDGWPLLALSLGFGEGDRGIDLLPDQFIVPPVVHLLEASTGRQRHTVLGLERARLADLNGDGLVDLWGAVDGELRAFRGEAPEVWRALGRFNAAGAFDRDVESIGSREVDFDADGVADVLIDGVIAPGERRYDLTGSHTVLARSGRDGHLIWKAQIDPRGSWFYPDGGDQYDVIAFPLPAGDLDGDGTADVIVKKNPGHMSYSSGPPETAPIELFSGRTGARLWSASLLGIGFRPPGVSQLDWTEPRVIEPHGTPDLIVQRGGENGYKLARISGRDGRILWEVTISNDASAPFSRANPPHAFGDLDGDGRLDLLTVMPQLKQDGTTEYTLLAFSLRDGKRLWSQPVRFRLDFASVGGLCVGDVDGDKQPDVVVLEAFDENQKDELTVRVFDGRDAKVRWTWKSGFAPQLNVGWQSIALADFDGGGISTVCIGFSVQRMFAWRQRFVVLDGQGKERVRRETIGAAGALKVVDTNGDGRDELLVVEGDLPGGRLGAWNGELKDLWTWPPRSKTSERRNSELSELESWSVRSRTIDRFLPASAGRAGTVVTTPALAIDVATAAPVWTGQAPLVSSPELENLLSHGGSMQLFGSPFQFAPKLLDPGDSARLPLLIANGLGATVCRVALPTTAQGAVAAPRGSLVQPGRARFDPRWTRPLPWRTRLKGLFEPKAWLAAGGLALVNVVLPLFFLRQVAGRRRAFRMWALMVVPIAAAVPLMCYLTLAPWLPVGNERLFASERRVFLVGALGGVPIVLYAWSMSANLLRLRFKPVVALLGLTVMASLLIAGGWVWFDLKSMARIQHYGWAGWELVLLPGAYAAAVLWGAGWALIRAFRLVRRPRR
jgi:hypothetical protein